MKRLFITWLIGLFINSYQANCQQLYSVDKWIEYVEEMALETENEEQIESLYAELSYRVEHPFELNEVTAEQLRQLPFLSDLQIQNLLEYRKRYGRILTLYELKSVDSFDFETISLLLPFVYIGEKSVDKRPITVKNLLKQGINNLQIRYDRCFQQKKGYSSYPDSVLQQYPNRKYLGEPFYHSVRYSYAFDERIQLGLVAEKDAGEPFWNTYHKGYDYYSVHFFLKDVNKWLKSLALGDYKVSFGQGLVVSHDFSPSRNAIVSQAERRRNGFRRHFSTNENDFFRGTATTLGWKQFDISLFYSRRKQDANMDSIYITSFKTDGLHRLLRDREKMRNVTIQTMGGNVRYATPNLCLGLTAIAYTFGNHVVWPDEKPYNRYYFRGNRNWNIGVDYLLKNKSIKFYGETAVSRNGAIASLNALQLTPISYFSFLLLGRYYDKRYQAFYGNAFSQNSTVQNEQGIYMGMQWTPFAHWKLSAYVDWFRFPYMKYGVDAPSNGKEYMCQVDYALSSSLSFYIRYKYKQKEKNRQQEDTQEVSILPYSQQRLRMQMLCTLTPALSMRTSADIVLYEQEQQKNRGWMAAQMVSWKPISIPFQTDLYAAFFQTDDYQTRIYSYEKNILYAFNMPSFYGKGIRLAASVRWDILKQLSLSAKLGYTYYMDRDVIGTDLEEINGNQKMDLYALLRWKF